MYFPHRGAYAPYATCMATSLDPTSSTDCSGVYLKRTCSRVTSASSAFAVLNDYARCTNPLMIIMSHDDSPEWRAWGWWAGTPGCACRGSVRCRCATGPALGPGVWTRNASTTSRRSPAAGCSTTSAACRKPVPDHAARCGAATLPSSAPQSASLLLSAGGDRPLYHRTAPPVLPPPSERRRRVLEPASRRAAALRCTDLTCSCNQSYSNATAPSSSSSSYLFTTYQNGTHYTESKRWNNRNIMEGCRRNYSSLSHQTPPTVISNKNNDPSSRVRNATHAA